MLAENEALRAELNRTLEAKAVAAAVAEDAALNHHDSSYALLREEIDLLRQVRACTHAPPAPPPAPPPLPS